MELPRNLFTIAVVGIYTSAVISACKTRVEPVSEVRSSAGFTDDGTMKIGDYYETDPAYADKVEDHPTNALLQDSVTVKNYDESHLFDSGIDQHLDHRLDTRIVMKDVEEKSGVPAGTFSSHFSPLAYGEALTKIGRPPEKFAAASVLAAMRRMRRFFYTVPFVANSASRTKVEVLIDRAAGMLKYPSSNYGSLASTITTYPMGTLYDDPSKETVYDSLKHDGGSGPDFKTPFDQFQKTWNSEGTGTDGNNLAVMPPFWDEIQANFYVGPPHRRHGCWTYGLQGAGVNPSSLAIWAAHKTAEVHLSRFAIRDMCTGRVFLPDSSGNVPLRTDYSSGWHGSLMGLPVQMSAYNLMWLDPTTREFLTPPEQVRNDLGVAIAAAAGSQSEMMKVIAALPAVRWAEAQRRKGMVNMWDYIMLHRLYAWDWKQQRAVINEYFSDHKRAKRWVNNKIEDGATSGIDIDNATDCSEWHPVRPGDASGGEQCKDTKKMTGAISGGR